MNIRTGEPEDFNSILAVINDAAQAYRGVIPHGQWHDPYMTTEELRIEISAGIAFWLAEDEGHLMGSSGCRTKVM